MTENERPDPSELGVEGIRETRTFTEDEIRSEISRIDQIENDVTILDIMRNPEGIIVSINFELRMEKAMEKFGSKVVYNYTIKGRHGLRRSSTTNIDRTYYDKVGECLGGDIVTEFIDGAWKDQ